MYVCVNMNMSAFEDEVVMMMVMMMMMMVFMMHSCVC
jgi:hypothetical protein